MEALLASFGETINEVVHHFLPMFMFGGGQFGLTQYIFWMGVAIALMLVVLFADKACIGKKYADFLVEKLLRCDILIRYEVADAILFRDGGIFCGEKLCARFTNNGFQLIQKSIHADYSPFVTSYSLR